VPVHGSSSAVERSQWRGRIVYSATISNAATDLFVVDGVSPQPHPLTYDHRGEHSPSWSPDGRSIAYSGYAGQADPALLIVRVNTRKPRVLLRKAASTHALLEDPAWSPTGRSIAFSLTERDETSACVMQIDDGYKCARPVTAHPTWSPRGARLAYTDGAGVVTSSADFRAVRRLKGTSSADSFPVWSPNGKWIALRSTRVKTRVDYLDIVTPTGKIRRRLVRSARGGAIVPVGWSPMSDAVLVLQVAPPQAGGGRQLTIVSIRTHHVVPLDATIGAVGSASWHR
jgi:Tol biopolymer transport system component